MEDLIWSPAWQVRERIAAGEITAGDVVEATLDRLAAVEPEIHAYTTICADQARGAGRR